MTNFIKKVTFIGVVLACISSAYAAPVVTNDNFNSAADKLNLEVSSNNPYKAYIKNTVGNLNALREFGEVYSDVSSVQYNKKPRFKASSNKTFSLSYFGAAADDFIGECVSFIKAVTNAKGTSNWYGNEKVSKNKKLTPYTPIATLTKTRSDGKPGYNSKDDGKRHVGLYLKHYNDGILMLDQNFYGDGKLTIHYLPFKGSNQSNAGNYYILEQN